MQLRLIDGQAIDLESVRFSGTVDIPDEDLEEFKYGNTMVLAMVATLDAGSFKRQPNGDTRRVNVLVPVAMRVAGGDLKNRLLAALGLSVQEPLPMTQIVMDGAEPPKEEEDDIEVFSILHDDVFPPAPVAPTPVVEEDTVMVVAPAPRVDNALARFLQEA